MKYVLLLVIALLLLALGFIAGSTYYYYSPLHTQIKYATAVIHPTQGNEAQGAVHFKQEKEGIRITATITGLTPGQHGFHIHEFGDCNCPDAVCAGDHFNPTNAPHGAPDSPHVHSGDLGNITADENGNAQYNAINKHVQLNGPHSIIGRALIVHEKKDDLISQPTGDSGARLGCGVIGISEK